jgi:RNA polymerase sigma-70 factor (ECF subfamily)
MDLPDIGYWILEISYTRTNIQYPISRVIELFDRYSLPFVAKEIRRLIEDSLEVRLLDHRAKLLAYVRKKVADPDLAEDILQESLLKALRAAPNLRDEEKLLPWFYRILNNAVVDSYRRRYTEAKSLEAYAAQQPLVFEFEDEATLCACFRELLPTLKPDYAHLIERLDLAGEDAAQVADQLDITRNNLKVRRHRARQALRQRLEETCRVCATHGCLDCTCRQL